MGWIDITLAVLTIIAGIATTIVIMMQNSKSSSSAITNETNTFYGANKNKTRDGMLSKLTVVLIFVFILLCFLTTVSIMK